jgi:hypothetical protein
VKTGTQESAMLKQRIAIVALIFIAATTALAQQKAKRDDVDGQIRLTSFKYYLSTVFGDSDDYLKVARMPLAVLRDGAITSRDEKATRTFLSQLADRAKSKNLSNEDKSQIAKNMIALFDDASVQFIGANTAELSFLIAKGAKPEEGDRMGAFVLHNEGGKWMVIMEVTDSAPIPPSYLLDVPKTDK